MEPKVFSEDTRYVRVALKTVALDLGEESLHFLLVVDVFGKDVLVERITGRAVDKQEFTLLASPGQTLQETPSALGCLLIRYRAVDLPLRPDNRLIGSHGARTKVRWRIHDGLLEVAEQDELPLN